MSEELKPCPFCNAAPTDEYANGCRYIYCLNGKCWVRPHVWRGPDEMERMGLRRDDYETWVAEQWNTRHPIPQAVTEEMMEFIAQEIYKRMPYDGPSDLPTKPPWIVGGNSIRQDDARTYAGVAIRIIAALGEKT